MAIEPYETSSGEDIEIKKIVKDLGVLATNDLMFREHIGKVTTECWVIMADIMRTFSIWEREPMIKLFNSYIKSKLEYCCVIWSPSPNGKKTKWNNYDREDATSIYKKYRRLGKLGLPSETKNL